MRIFPFGIQKHTHTTKCSEYIIWKMMRRRGTNKGHPNSDRYVLRGITICDRWAYGEDGLSGFDCFMKDMGPRPSDIHSVDRVDNSGSYEPNNCRWATPVEQQNNRQNNRHIEAFGRRLTISQWSRETGVSPHRLLYRLNAGWEIEDALTNQDGRWRRHAKARGEPVSFGWRQNQ